MSSPADRLKIAASIVNFEARRDSNGHLKVYNLPVEDGGGRYEVAGINERYDPIEAARLREMVEAGQFDRAEEYARAYIASQTDVALSWTASTAVESYLRDCVFNRGRTGAAKIYQMAVGVKVDGHIGPVTMAAAAEITPADLLVHLRAARERYEREYAKRNESSIFWKGLVNRWDKALTFARSFLEGTSAQPPGTFSAAVAPNAVAAVTDADGHGSSNPYLKPTITKFIDSPFHSSRNGAAIKMVVLHCTEADLASTIREFTENYDRQVSAHYVIARGGEIYQMVRDSDRANHARGANANSIGIEHVGGERDQLTDQQQQSSIALIQWLVQQYDIPRSEIYGHDFAPGYDRTHGGTSCPDKLFGSPHSQDTIRAWVNRHIR